MDATQSGRSCSGRAWRAAGGSAQDAWRRYRKPGCPRPLFPDPALFPGGAARASLPPPLCWVHSPLLDPPGLRQGQGREGRESGKLTNLPGKCLPDWRATCPGTSNLYFFQRNAVAAGPLITYICLTDEEKDAEEVDFNRSSLRTAHWDVLFRRGF